MLPIRITGLGWYLPDQRLTTHELATRFGIDPELVERTTGVKERRVANGETTAQMAAKAARMAFDHAAIDGTTIDAIIGASASTQQAIPCTAAFVQRELGLPEGRSVCFDINATCLSFLFALQTAAQSITLGQYRSVLIFSSEIASVSLNPHQWQSSALFGDAAAAVVVTAAAPDEQRGLVTSRCATFSSGADLTQVLGGGTRQHPNNPSTTAEMNTFLMDGPGIFRQALREFTPFFDDVLETIGWEPRDVDLLVPHQASRRAIEQLSTRFGFTKDQVFTNLAERGNCVGASLPLALAEAAHAGRINDGAKILMVGTGAGLTIGVQALMW